MKIIIIAAIAKNNVIGDSVKGLPWHLPEDFKHFKKTTSGHPIIMGSRTFVELGKPLVGRLNIVLSYKVIPQSAENDLLHFTSFAEAIEFCSSKKYEKIFIIGGAMIYAAALPYATDMILSYTNFEAKGDIHFPPFNINEWSEIRSDSMDNFTIKYLTRIK